MLRFIIIIFTLFSPRVDAGVSDGLIQCLDWLAGPQISEENYIWPAGPLEEVAVGSPSKYASINTELFTIVRVVRGIHGGERLVLRRNIAWHDGRRNVNGDMASITQDLRLPSALLGVLEARFFGFQQISSREIIVPTVDEINRAINAFNKGLSPNDPRLIKVRYYESTNPIETAEDYVRRFARPTRIPTTRKVFLHDPVEVPVSLKGRSFAHDISAHVLEGVFGHNEYFEILQGRSRLWLDFVDYVTSHDAEGSDFNLWNKRVMDSFALQIDELGMSSGNFLDDDSELYLRRVGLSLVRASQAYKDRNQIAKDPQIKKRSFLLRGMMAKYLPTLTHSAWDFLTQKSFVKNIPPSSFGPMLKAFIGTQFQLHPERLELLTFDLTAEGALLNKILNEEKNLKKREAAMATLPISSPYVGRLNRIRDLISASPNFFQ